MDMASQHPEVPGIPVGTTLKTYDEILPKRKGFQLPYRFIALPDDDIKNNQNNQRACGTSEPTEKTVRFTELGILKMII